MKASPYPIRPWRIPGRPECFKMSLFPYLYCMDVHFVTYSTYVIYTPQQIALRPKRLFKWLKMGPDLSSDVKKRNRVVSFPILKIATVVCKGLTL